MFRGVEDDPDLNLNTRLNQLLHSNLESVSLKELDEELSDEILNSLEDCLSHGRTCYCSLEESPSGERNKYFHWVITTTLGYRAAMFSRSSGIFQIDNEIFNTYQEALDCAERAAKEGKYIGLLVLPKG